LLCSLVGGEFAADAVDVGFRNQTAGKQRFLRHAVIAFLIRWGTLRSSLKKTCTRFQSMAPPSPLASNS